MEASSSHKDVNSGRRHGIPSFALSQPSARLPKSRKDRPCDHCRRLKHTCEITIRGRPCANCVKGRKDCTFIRPAPKRQRVSSTSPRPSINPLLADGTGNIASEYETRSSTPLRHANDFIVSEGSCDRRPSAPAASASNMHLGGFRHTTSGEEEPLNSASSLKKFMETLERDDGLQDMGYDSPNEDYPSLEQDVTDLEESHYLGHRAFGDLTLDPFPTGHGVASLPTRLDHHGSRLQYRQVGSAQDPAFFLRNPSKVYGVSNVEYVAEKAYVAAIEILRQEAEGLQRQLVILFLVRTLPMLPILRQSKLEYACYANEGVEPSILTGIIAHAAIHMISLRPRIKELWSIVLRLLENEYRQPRLQTIQLALIDIYGRPILNPGGNHVAISRAIGAAQLLGLRRDCSRWKLPKWERESRHRLWWCLYIADKWNAFCYGRPSNIHGRPLTPLPSASDSNHNEVDVTSRAFVRACRLSLILDSLLPLLGAPERGAPCQTPETLLRQAMSDLDDIAQDEVAQPVDASVNLARLGIAVAICRLNLDDMSSMSHRKLAAVLTGALSVAGEMTAFLESLNNDHWEAFWSPWSCFQVVHGFSLLLFIASTAQQNGHIPSVVRSVAEHTYRQVQALQWGSEACWEVAEVSLSRIKLLLGSVPFIAELQATTRLLAPHDDLASLVGPSDSNLAVDLSDFSHWINSTDWMTGMPSWIDGISEPPSV